MKQRVLQFVSWVSGRELIVLVSLLTITIGVWGFIVLADEVIEGDTHAFDEAVVQAMRQNDDPEKPIGPEWMAEFGRDITALGGWPVLFLLTLFVVGFLWLDKRYGAMWFVLAAVLSGNAVGMLLKRLFSRERPAVVPHLAEVYTTSFPSGHSMMSAIVYLTLGVLLTRLVATRRLKLYFMVLAVILAALVGASRVYLGVHYPTDVLAGWTAGLVWALLCWLAARALQKRGAVEKTL